MIILLHTRNVFAIVTPFSHFLGDVVCWPVVRCFLCVLILERSRPKRMSGWLFNANWTSFTHTMARTIFNWWYGDNICFGLDKYAKLEVHSDSQLKQESVGGHVAALWHIILIQYLPSMLNYACLRWGRQVSILTVFCHPTWVRTHDLNRITDKRHKSAL